MGIITKIKTFLKLNSILKESAKVKSGLFTTEFWSKNVVQLVVLYNALYKKDLDPQTAVAIVVALEGGYIAFRSLVKAAKDLVAQNKGLTPPQA